MKIKNIIFRDAKPSDIDEILNIICISNLEILEKTIYGQRGAYNYVYEKILDNTHEIVYKVIELENNIISVVELRIYSKYIFINFIAVIEEFQYKGIGKFIMKKIFDEYNKNKEYLELDVFEMNKVAYNWYKKMNFKKVFSSYWIEFQNNKYYSIDFSYNIENLYSEYYKKNGFDISNVTVDGKKYNVGLIGDKYIRLYDNFSIELIKLFLTIKKEKKLFSIIDSSMDISYLCDEVDINITNKSFRMRVSFDKISL